MNNINLNQDYPDITQSKAWLKRSQGLMPSNCQTLAKGPGQYVGGSPVFLQRGEGSHVWDVDGNVYIDLNMGIGPLSLGYRYPKVDEAIRQQLEEGIVFSLVHPLEVEVAELIREVVPNAEMVRFSKTGADATSAAVRVSRAFTGRSKVLCCGYHGWHDWYITTTDRSAGIPEENLELSHTIQYNDLDHLERSLGPDTACLILEPIVFEEAQPGYLQGVKQICEKNGTLLIFDEMWTGFRLALGGAQEYFGVQPDLAVYSKAIANGMPISVITGRGDVMQLFDKQVFFYTTFGGEALSLAATKATIHELRDKRVPDYLHSQGAKLKDGYKALVKAKSIDYSDCVGYNCRTMVSFDAKAGDPRMMKSLLQQEMIKRGVLWGGFHNMSFAHDDEDVAHILAAYDEALDVLDAAVKANTVEKSLRGEPVEPVFRRVGNFNTKPRSA